MQRPHHAHARRVCGLTLRTPRLQDLNLDKHTIFEDIALRPLGAS